ncbi:4'-phosphopantetheinyl transferase family protein [Salinivibrio kushneri]|uniref:4'-phosphopantetheinyl transferase family protein n=1 Tax=Salinivibrio kushneri TaxID=1908198 RepID=UPI0018E37A29|nr:4'-phosphopantetheinyl transferase superfamily protein [Salinivibrio kushneri]
MVQFDVQHYSPMLFAKLGIEMPEAIRRAVCKRQAEFLAGRYLAKKVQMSLGVMPIEIAIGDSRAPVWPSAWTGSISHNDSLAICAMTPQSNEHEGVGIDIESVIDVEKATEMEGVVFTEKERGRLPSDARDISWLMTLLFSAKESIFKALYPQVQCYFDFLDVTFLRMDAQWLYFELNTRLADALVPGIQGKVYYAKVGEKVMTFTRSEYFI